MLVTFGGQVEATQWISAKHNMGMVINRLTWDKITACSNSFCQVSQDHWAIKYILVSFVLIYCEIQIRY